MIKQIKQKARQNPEASGLTGFLFLIQNDLRSKNSFIIIPVSVNQK